MSSDDRAAPDAARRLELVALLDERSRLLAPRGETIDRALARCVRHDLRAKNREEASDSRRLASQPASEVTATPPTAQASATLPSMGAPAGAAGSAGAPEQASDHATNRTLPDSLIHTPVRSGELIPAGTIVAGYRIEGLLGKGGMGQVYRAVQLSVQREVAFKVLSARLAGNAGFRERFLREARAAGRLHHFNLISVHDVGEAAGMMFFSMELVEGRTVKELIDAGHLTLEASLDITAQTLGALKYAHERGIIHRDIKPDNLMVTASGAVKVADLGLSRIASLSDDDGINDSGTTQAGTIMGTPHYMSPEQGRDAHAADHRTDLYSMGATLYHMVCGKPPFTGGSPVEVVLKATTAPLVFPEPGPPGNVRAFIARLMAKQAADRFATAADALAALDRLRGRGSITTDPGKRIHRYIQRRRRLRRLLPAGAMIAAVVVAALVIAVIVKRSPSDALARDQQQIQALAAASKYAQALALLEADSAGLAKDSRRAQQADEQRSSLEEAWDGWSEQTLQPSVDQFDSAMKGKRLEDAWNALKAVPEDQLSPRARQQLDERLASFFDRATEELSTKPAVGTEDHPNPKLGILLLRWLRATPAGSLQVKDSAATFTGVGSATLGTPFDRNLRMIEATAIELRVRAPAFAKGDHWDLRVGKWRMAMSDEGTRLELDGKTLEILPAAADATVRITRANGALQVRVGDGAITAVGGIDSRIEFGWSLTATRAVELGARMFAAPIGERRPRPSK